LASHWYAAGFAHRWKLPWILSTHGQLEPWHWGDKGLLHFFKKKLYWKLLAKPRFRATTALHAITRLEQEHLEQLLPHTRTEVIPNAVDLSEIDEGLPPIAEEVGRSRQPWVVFLGRFHPKKGVEMLVQAFARSRLSSEWRLVLAGPPGPDWYMRRILSQIQRPPLAGRVQVLGLVTGLAKWRLYRSAFVVAVPSFSEAIGMVNLEAGGCGTPTITTHETGLEDWETGGGVVIHPTLDDLTEALERTCGLGFEEHAERCKSIRALVEQRYSWKVVGDRWLSLYQELTGTA
jgi:glycosyltransferase involved in cell wall biosynthesis